MSEKGIGKLHSKEGIRLVPALAILLTVLTGIALASCSPTVDVQCQTPVTFVSVDPDFSMQMNSVCGNSRISPEAQNLIIWNPENSGMDYPPGFFSAKSITHAITDEEGKVIGCEVDTIAISGNIDDEELAVLVKKEGEDTIEACDSLAQTGVLDKYSSPPEIANDPLNPLGPLLDVAGEIDAGALLIAWEDNPEQVEHMLGDPPQEVMQHFTDAAEGPWLTTCKQIKLVNLLFNNGRTANPANLDLESRICGGPIRYWLNMPIPTEP